VNHQPLMTAVPGDIPIKRSPALARLDALLGEWVMEATFEAGYLTAGTSPVISRGGRTIFEWLDGEFFLLQRFTVANPAAPSGIAIIGATHEADTFTQHYYDSRGVARIYQTSLNDGVWRVWREVPGFYQRYTGTFSSDGATITGAWEGSTDGTRWQHDFSLSYFKIV
jgi:hypothetical protein